MSTMPARPPSQTMTRSEAFHRYVTPELDVLFRVACSLTGNPHDAEDLVQDTLLAAYRRLDRFDGRHPRAWLITILKNRQRSQWRRRRPAVADAETLPDVPDTDPGPEAVVVGPGETADVMSAFFALGPEHRRVVELVDVAGLRYREAAQVLGVPVGTVTSRLHSARREIRARLDGENPGAARLTRRLR